MSKLTKSIITTIVGLTLVALVVPVVVSADDSDSHTIQQLQAQVAQLLAQLNALLAQQGQPPAQTGAMPAACVGVSFTRDVEIGMTGQDVKCLQALLNTNSATVVASSGAGSSGNETTYFGPLTAAAVQKYQTGPMGLSYSVPRVGPLTRQALNNWLTSFAGAPSPTPSPTPTPTPVPIGTGLEVRLASDNPATGTIVDTQALYTLAKLTFLNGDNSEVTVTGLKLKRTGVSGDTSIKNLYLFQGATRLTDAISISETVANVNNSAGLFKVPANSSVTISAIADVDGTAGETIGIQVTAADSVTSNASSVKGTFPINGNSHSVAAKPSTFATVDYNATTTPSKATINPQDAYTVWQNSVTIGNKAVDLHWIAFRKTGSVKVNDLQNFMLYVDGEQVGTTQQLFSNLFGEEYVVFDLSSSPKKLDTGTRVVKLTADIVGGSNLNFTMHMWNAADASFIDTQYGAGVLATADGSSFSKRSSGAQTVDKGVITISKKSNSPSGDVVDKANSQSLAKFEVKASGEAVKIEDITVQLVLSDSSVGKLRNGALYANGIQIGSTADITTAAAGTKFSLGSSLIAEPGSPVEFEVKSDVFDNDGTNDINADDTIKVRLIKGSSNGTGQVSSETINVPTADTDGNTLTVKTGGLTLAEYTAYADRTVVSPLTNFKLGHFTLTANTTEAVNVTDVQVDLNEVSGASTNLYVQYGNETTSVKATTSNTQSWSINYNLPTGATVDVMVFMDVDPNANLSAGTGKASVLIKGTTTDSATAVDTNSNAVLAGQTITFGTASLNDDLDGSSPVDRVVYGGQTEDNLGGVIASKFRFTAVSDNVKIKELQVKVDSATVSGAIKEGRLYDGSTLLATQPFSAATSTAANFTGLINKVSIPANTSKTLTVVVVLADIVDDYSNANVDASVDLDSYVWVNSSGSETTVTVDIAGKEMRVFKSVPTFTHVSLGTSNLTLGTTDLYKFNVKANGGQITLKQLKFDVTITDAGGATTPILDTFKFFRGSQDITSLVTIQNSTGKSLESTTFSVDEEEATDVVVTFDTEEVVGSGATQEFRLRARATGFAASTTGNDSVSVFLKDDTSASGADDALNEGTTVTTITKLHDDAAAGNASATNHNVIWSDYSAISHVQGTVGASSSEDWMNGYLLLDLPLSSSALVVQ